MILIDKVIDYGNKLLNDIPALKKFDIVCDDSQLALLVKDFTYSDNILLIGFIPSHETIGTNVDNVQDVDIMLWLVLEKNDSKDGHKATIESFKRTQLAVKAIKTQMLSDKPNFSCSNTMKDLEVASFAIDPVWGLAGCDGWEINYKLKTPSY